MDRKVMKFCGAAAALVVSAGVRGGTTPVVLDSQTRTLHVEATATNGPPDNNTSLTQTKDDAATGFTPFNSAISTSAAIPQAVIATQADQTAQVNSTISTTDFSVAGSASGFGTGYSQTAFNSPRLAGAASRRGCTSPSRTSRQRFGRTEETPQGRGR